MKTKELSKTNWNEWAKWMAASLLFLWPFLYVTINVNDDAFVYYTYAKNLAQGNLFTYDPRGIPSEGFTSLLYLILLVPFQWLAIPLPLAGLLINVGAILGTAIVSWKIYELLFPEKKEGAWFALVVFLVAAYLDPNITGLMGWGLETLVNGFVFALLIHRFLFLAKTGSRRDFGTLLLLYASSILIRPENLLVAAPWVVLGLIAMPSKKEGIKLCFISLCFSAVFLFVKYQIFGDFVPTGFYRKVANQSLNLNYLMNYLREYAFVLVGVTGLILFALVKKESPVQKDKTIKLGMMGFGVTLMFLVLVVSKVNPMQGYMQRFLIVGTILAYVILAFALSTVLHQTNRLKAGLVLMCLMALYGGLKQRQRSTPIALYKDTLKSLKSDAYVELAKYLQNKIPRPAEVSLMFGDAGAIPYFFGCKFLDINGLTEPFLARMFKDENKRKKVAQYVSDQKVDIAVLAIENEDINLTKDSQRLPQGPLSKPEDYAYLLRQMRRDGFVYAGTVRYPIYDLHFGINRNSPRFLELKKVLFEYMDLEKGFIKKGDLRVEFSDGDVIFENVHQKTL